MRVSPQWTELISAAPQPRVGLQPSRSVSPELGTFKMKRKIESLSPGRAGRDHTTFPLLPAACRFHQQFISARTTSPEVGETEA